MSAESLRRATRAKHERALARDRQYEPFLREHRLRGSGWLAEQLGWPVWKVQKTVARLGIEFRHKTGPAPGRGHFWTGGRIVDKSGYVLLYRPDHLQRNSGGYVREHRLVMEQHLGRPLTPAEVVHHRNGDRADNRIENLELHPHNGTHMAQEWTGRKHSLATRQKMRESALRVWSKRLNRAPPANRLPSRLDAPR